LDVRFFGRHVGAQPVGDFVMVALPDTQYYSQMYPEIFLSQTRWIVDNRENLNIVFVIHLGDIVQIGSNDYEWQNADAAMGLLGNSAETSLVEGIPYGLSVGNHDQNRSNHAGYPEDDGTSTTLEYNQYFGVGRFSKRSYYGGHFLTNNDNSYQLFSVGGLDFLVIHHEFDDTFVTMLDQVLPWTDDLLKTHRDRRAILASHSLLCHGVSCPSTLWAEFSTQGQLTYDALKDNSNLSLMICGHAGTSLQQPRRSDVWNGHTIHTFLADYQRFENCPFRCGNGWLRILNFNPANDEIHVQTYSPWLDEYRSEPCKDGNSCHDFTLPYDMDGGVPFGVVGSLTGVPSGTDVCVPWTGRQAGETFEWYVEASNGTAWSLGPRWNFVSAGTCIEDGSCEDGHACTSDTCVDLVCSRTALPGCCETDADCDDGNHCTDDLCASNQCTHTDNQNDCLDGDPCTEGDVCSSGVCSGTAMVCEDGNLCTVDACVDGSCVNTYPSTPKCCTTDSDCADESACTVDTCRHNGHCLNTPQPLCCDQDPDCDDGDTCTFDTCGRNSGSFRFDGINDHAFVGRIDDLGHPHGLTAKRFTVECWFNWDGTGETADTAGWPFDSSDIGITAYPLVTKGAKGRDDLAAYGINYFLGIDESGVLAADLEEHISGYEPASNHSVLGSTPVNVDQWHHAAVTYDGQCWQLYLDGQAETDGNNCPGVKPAFDTDAITGLGTALDVNGTLQGRFAGLMDEVRIWNRALSQQAIIDGMHLQIEGAPNLMGRWGLDEHDGMVFTDSTGHEHYGGVHDVTVEPLDVAPVGQQTCDNAVPESVAGVLWEDYPELRMIWEHQPGMAYDVVGGLLSELQLDDGTDQAQCLMDDSAWSFFVDQRPDPSPGEGYYFIVRSIGPCNASSYGTAFPLSERIVLNGCP
jgi:hypothetical protein